jgi:hypothetical protein
MMALGISFLGEVFVYAIHSTYLPLFLRANIVNLQIALLAVNTATLGIVLTKIKDVTSKGVSVSAFSETRSQMLLSIKEQVALIVASLFLLSLSSSIQITTVVPSFVFDTLLLACFTYSIMVLYDTAISVLVILDAPR